MYIETPTVEPDILDYFMDTLPDKPYFKYEKAGQRVIRDKANALKYPYIEPNDPFENYWIVYDVDRPTAHFDWQDVHAPPPNITATNGENGHAHLFYGLENPVLTAEYNPKVHSSPIRYIAAIDLALTEKLQADPGYAGQVAKNPLSPYWNVQIWQDVPYTLNWLEGYVDLKPYRDKRVHLPPERWGRNCIVFETVRTWSYREFIKGGFLHGEFFENIVLSRCQAVNSQFKQPLGLCEIRCIARSIVKFCYAKFSKAEFSRIQSFRGKKGGLASALKRQELKARRNDKIIEYLYLYPNTKQQELALIFDVSLSTIKHNTEIRGIANENRGKRQVWNGWKKEA